MLGTIFLQLISNLRQWSCGNDIMACKTGVRLIPYKFDLDCVELLTISPIKFIKLKVSCPRHKSFCTTLPHDIVITSNYLKTLIFASL